MLKTSFLEILRALDKEELKRFEAFLSSPYFNTRSHVVKLYNVIKKHAPDFNDKDLDKEEVWKKIFPGKEYNYGILKNIIYDITKFAERFLEVEELNSNEQQRMKNLLKSLGDKHLENIFMNKYNSFEKNFFKSTKFYNEYYGEYLDLMLSRFRVEAFNPRIRTKFLAAGISEFMIFDFLAKFSNNFNNYYVGESEFNEIPENDFIRRFSKSVFSDTELESYVDGLSTGADKNYKVIIIFFKLMKCYLNPNNTELYYDFKKTLFANDKYISESGMRGLYASLGSALDNCNNASGINKNRELYEIIYQLAEKNIFLSEEGKTIPSLYIVSVKTAGYLKETMFIERIIKEFLPKTEAGLQDNFKIFSLAYLHYSKNEFDKVLEYTNKVSIDTFQMKYFLRNLQIIVSYEKNDYDMFQYLSDSYRHFLSKNKSVSQSYKESNMKFLNYINTLFRIRESNDRSEAGFVESTLREDTVVNKYWILEKVRELR